MIAAYNTTKNAFRLLKCVYGINSAMKDNRNKIQVAAERVTELCQQNEGIYARLAQVMARWNGVLPS